MLLKVLYIHGVSVYGGSTRSLLELLTSLPEDNVEPLVICPKGKAADLLEENGIDVHRVMGIASFDHTQIGHYRGLRWLILIRTLLYLFPTIFGLRKALKMKKWDLVHINDGTLLIPGLIVLLTRLPLVWHFRTVMNTNGWRWKAIRKLVNAASSRVIAIDRSVAKSLDGIKNVEVIHNCVPLADKDTSKTVISKKLLGFTDDTVIFAMLGIMIPYKGIFDFLDAARRCMNRCNNVGFLFIGGNAQPNDYFQSLTGQAISKTGLTRDYKEIVQRRIEEYGISDKVKIVDFIKDTGSIYKTIDILCFPSHLEATGRPVFEAAMYKKPSIAALSSGGDDLVINGETGLVVMPKRADELGDAMMLCANSSELRKRLGEKVYKVAISRHDCDVTKEKIIQLYRSIINQELFPQ